VRIGGSGGEEINPGEDREDRVRIGNASAYPPCDASLALA